MCGVRSPGWLGCGCESCCDGSADKCSSIHERHFTPSRRKGNRDSVRKKSGPSRTDRPFSLRLKSEIKTQTELHPAPLVSVGQVQEAARAKVSVDLIELGVIEEVKVFPAEVESSLLVNRELLEEAEVEVETSRQC